MSSKLHHPMRLHSRMGLARPLALLLLVSAFLWPQNSLAQAAAASTTAVPTIHVPYFTGGADPSKGAIFWFGKVDPAANYANVRMAYNDAGLGVALHIFDRRAAFDEGATSTSDLTQWDAVTLYVDTQSDLVAPLTAGTYRFDGQLSQWGERTNYQRSYQWEAGAWKATPIAFETGGVGFRGDAANDARDDRGWTISFTLPFASLGLSAAPSQGAVWRMALALHDRDDPQNAVLPDQYWPASADPNQPATWGRIGFGVPVYNPPAATDTQTLAIRHGVNGIVAPDAAVGGHSVCGAQFDPNFFNGWGDANYPGFAQFNIQNQWDVADWPCYSKYYVTFPLATLPSEAAVVSATLTLYMFGNAGYQPGDAKPSYVQVARVTDDWDEQTLTWNNAPPVLENYSWAVVNPMASGDPPTKPFTWDLARAVADAHAAGQPLRLVIYSTDGDYHSGKYFWSADADEGVRPLLNIKWGAAGPAGYTLSATPVKAMIRSGETATYELNLASLSAGETVTLEVGASEPSGLEVSITPKTIAAPGGKAVVSLIDRSDKNSTKSILYKVPVKAISGEQIRAAEITVLVNGRQLFLPALKR